LTVDTYVLAVDMFAYPRRNQTRFWCLSGSCFWSGIGGGNLNINTFDDYFFDRFSGHENYCKTDIFMLHRDDN
jgi:hypothetical protein